MSKRLTKIVVLAIMALFCFVGFFTFGLSGSSANAATTSKENTVTFTDDFTSGGRLSSKNFIEYNHVAMDQGSTGNADYGLIPAAAWGGSVDYGTGYFIYEIKPSTGMGIKDFTISFITYFGYANIADYYGKTDIQISVSTEKENFGDPVFSLFSAKSGSEFSVKDSSGNDCYGLGAAGNYNSVTVSGDLTKYLSIEETNYVKITLKHMSTEEIDTAFKLKTDTNGNQTYPNGLSNGTGKIYLNYCGIRMKSLTISYKESKPTKLMTISKDFTANNNTTTSGLGFYEYDHVYKPAGGHGFGLIPSSTWADSNICSNLGDGYFVYKLTPDNNYYFDGVELDLTISFDHKGLAGCIGATKSNFNIYLSSDNVNYTQVFSMYNASNWTNFTVKRADTEDTFTGGITSSGALWSPLEYNISGDVSSYLSGEGDVYVKFELIQMDYNELNEWCKATYGGKTISEYYGDQTTVGSDINQNLALSRVNVTVCSLDITGYQSKSKVSGGSAFYDYSSYEDGSTGWMQDAYAYSGLQIVDQVDYSNTGGSTNSTALSSNKQSEGYVIYKYQAKEGYAFGTGGIEMTARLFDYNQKGNGEKVDFYISYDNETYTMIYSCPITNNHKSSLTKFSFDEYVFGENVFYLKLVIGNSSNYPEWTNVGSLAVNLTYQSSRVNIDFGNNYVQRFSVTKGTAFDTTQVSTMPEGFTRADDKLYTDAACTQVFDSTTVILGDTMLYVKGVWDKFTVSYNLDGGTNAANNPEYYVSAVGSTLYVPTKTGYTFAGWYTESTFENYIDNIPVGRKGNVALYAKWVEDVEITLTFSITYNLEGGTNNANNPVTYTPESGATLYDPTKDGYTFLYWKDGNGATVENIAIGRMGDVVLTAYWQVDSSDVANIVSATLTLGKDLTLNYYVNINYVFTTAEMRFTMNGSTFTAAPIMIQDYYRFDFIRIAPQCLGDNVKAELIIDGETKALKDNYSVLTYCQNLLNNNPSGELATLLADILEYGAKAQLYKDYKTDSLVNTGITGQTSFVSITQTDYTDSVSTEENVGIVGMGVWFDYNNRIYAIYQGENARITISAEGLAETEITIKENVQVDKNGSLVNAIRAFSDGIYATDFDKVYTFKLYNGDTLVQTVTYSVKSFVYNNQAASSDLKADLVKALYNYGLSSKAYAATLGE